MTCKAWDHSSKQQAKYTLICNMHEQMIIWSVYLLNMTQQFMKGPQMRRNTLTSCIGRQPSSLVWVLQPDLQINAAGIRVQREDQEYFWCVQQKTTTCIGAFVIMAIIFSLGMQNMLLVAYRWGSLIFPCHCPRILWGIFSFYKRSAWETTSSAPL